MLLTSAAPPQHADVSVVRYKPAKLSGSGLPYQSPQAFYRRQYFFQAVYTWPTHDIVSLPGPGASSMVNQVWSKYVHDPTLRLLLTQINSFRLCLPSHLRRPTQHLGLTGTLDRDLVTAIMIAHA